MIKVADPQPVHGETPAADLAGNLAKRVDRGIAFRNDVKGAHSVDSRRANQLERPFGRSFSRHENRLVGEVVDRCCMGSICLSPCSDLAVQALSFSFEPADIINEVMSFGSPTPVEIAVRGKNLSQDGSMWAES
jgi:hypothetical protein